MNFSAVAKKKPKNVSTQAEQLKNMCPAPQEATHGPKAFLMKQVGCGGFEPEVMLFAFKEGREKSVCASEHFNNEPVSKIKCK